MKTKAMARSAWRSCTQRTQFSFMLWIRRMLRHDGVRWYK
jgi:hypothetical protein